MSGAGAGGGGRGEAWEQLTRRASLDKNLKFKVNRLPFALM